MNKNSLYTPNNLNQLPEEILSMIYKNVYSSCLSEIKDYDKTKKLKSINCFNGRNYDIYNQSAVWSAYTDKSNSDYLRKQYINNLWDNYKNKRNHKEGDWIKLLHDLERPVIWEARNWYIRKWISTGGGVTRSGINWSGNSVYEPGKLSTKGWNRLITT